MADIATRKESCNFSEFAGWLDVSRQLSITGGTTAKSKSDIPATVQMWESLPWLADK